jgi:nitroreductase
MAWELTPDRFAGLVADAVRAPSMHNTQPWRFRLTAPAGLRGPRSFVLRPAQAAIEVLLDPQRQLPVGDPTGRAARVACGAVLFNLRLALAVAGTPAEVQLCPEPDLVARLVPGAPRPATPHERRLHAAIPRRHSNRYPLADVPVPPVARADLVRAADDEGCWLHVIESPADADAAADLVREADRILRADPAYVTELRTWTGFGATADQGVPGGAGGPEPDQHELLTRRDFGGPPAHRSFERAPLLAVLGANGDHPADEVVAGMALQRVLLTATDLGLATSIFTQPIDTAQTRDRLRVVCRRRYPPHAVLRVGYGDAPHRSGRRPVAEVIAPPR